MEVNPTPNPNPNQVIRTTMEDRAVAKYSAPVAQLLQRSPTLNI